MSKMWEVDPETKAKLLQISKTNGNDKCCDCGAPSPQWVRLLQHSPPTPALPAASPKFGTFICLNCAGTHRGLGVHISFVRSITMDAFKNAEIQRMELGGNEPWKSFFDDHPVTQSEGRTFEDSTIKERYEGEVGEEWKERLSAKVEGRPYVPGQKPAQPKKKPAVEPASSRSSTPLGRASPASHDGFSGMGGGRKELNEAYFAKLGSENSTRSDSVPPSQGGRFTGFGGGMPVSSGPSRNASGGNVPGFDEFQKDPMAALTKGFGWFTTAVGKGAKTVNDSYIQPTAKTIAESDFAAQARQHATQLGQNIQVGARGAAGQFQRFVEGPDENTAARRRVEPERKDFWDDFSALGQEENHRRNVSRSSAIGTAAMKPGPSSTSAQFATTSSAAPSGASTTGNNASSTTAKEKDEWDNDW
ncbi:Zn finger-containing GTPase- Activating Protein for ARF [Aspergillus alliaceus]|uniref:Zn finger-containing GTPase- Activating Protein for ARF n=1 Tax=Petromyces alliaceus TaxID=209559 RepID=A0A8H6E5M2_PETAA|nr:Zn finger-containing GTPase- Activating Protein for ARF [Aspergillus burnettii]